MELVAGWEVAAAPGGLDPGADALASLDWLPATVPGTAAGALAAAGRPAREDYDTEDWWFRQRFTLVAEAAGRPLRLELEGVATVSEAYIDGELVSRGESMWEMRSAELPGLPAGEHELLIACRALAPLLARRRRPAARWRTRVVNAGNLRWYRTMVFGRSPGFAPGPAPVGPWRPVRLTARDRTAIRALEVRPRLEGTAGIVAVTAHCDGAPDGVRARLGAGNPVELEPSGDGSFRGELVIAEPALWWPHTHGEPHLHDLVVAPGGGEPARRRVGFRALGRPADPVRDGLGLSVNGVPVFCRGAVWTPADLVSLAPSLTDLRALLGRVRDAGMNMLRVVGTGAYEPAGFHDLCDELGLLVWQDLMFANLDYPVDDPEFAAVVEAEARGVLAALAGRPSFAVLCGNSEVEQQPAMMGLDPELGRHPLWQERLPALLAESGADCAFLPSTPCGGVLPFHPDGGSTHYFGVSGYMLPVIDVRRAEVRFAAECLAFANVPDEVQYPVHHPRWKQGVPRDAGTGWDLGAGWDFDDVRDAYLSQLYGVQPAALRRYDHERYLELSRAVSGEVMAQVMGDWRRAASGCRGALVLWLKDLLPGAGLGVLDHEGAPKAAYHFLRRALAPTAIWLTDEGVGGVAIHVAHDGGAPLAAQLELALYRDGETRVAAAAEALSLAPHSQLSRAVEGLLGRFVDPAWAYRFGPPTATAVVATLTGEGGAVLSQAFLHPAGFPLTPEPAQRLGLSVTARRTGGADGPVSLSLEAARLVYGVRIEAPGCSCADSWFSLEPGRPREVALAATDGSGPFRGAAIAAINLAGRVEVAAP